MKITNIGNIPKAIVKAIEFNWYSGLNAGHEVSATELLSPPKVVLLRKRHYDEIEVDASERIWLLLGSAVHSVIEKNGADLDKCLVEKRYNATVDNVILGGGVDYFDLETKTIHDFKLTTVLTWDHLEDRLENYSLQLNIYKYLMEKNGFEVDNLALTFIFRDWYLGNAVKKVGYPKIIETVKIHVMEDIEARIKALLKNYCSAQKLEDDLIPPCSLSERWERGAKFNVIDTDNYSILRYFYTEEEAEEDIDNLNSLPQNKNKDGGPKFKIEYIPGQLIRCDRYCDVKEFCHFYKKIKGMQMEYRKHR